MIFLQQSEGAGISDLLIFLIRDPVDAQNTKAAAAAWHK
jgi:hypothetical protein